MKTYAVILEENVASELEEAYLWIARESLAAAHHWYNGCVAALQTLETFPERCSLAPEDGYFEEEIRHLLFGSFRILFTIRRQSVHVLHARHSARDVLEPDDEADNG